MDILDVEGIVGMVGTVAFTAGGRIDGIVVKLATNPAKIRTTTTQTMGGFPFFGTAPQRGHAVFAVSRGNLHVRHSIRIVP